MESCCFVVVVVVFDLYEYPMDLCNELCSTGHLYICLSCVAKTLLLDIACKDCSDSFLHTCQACRHH